MSYENTVVPIPLGEDGLTGSRNLSQIRPSQLLTALNVSYADGSIKKEGGATKYNSSVLTGAPSVLGGWDWIPVPGTQRQIVYLSSGTIKKDSGDGTFPTTMATDRFTGAVPVFAEGGQETVAANRKLFICNGYQYVQVISGDASATTNLALPPADWQAPSSEPVSMCNHDGRMWGAVGHRVYYSTRTNHEDFADVTNAGSLAIFPGEGEKIVQIMSFKGLLVVWKFPVGIYVINTTDPTVTNWTINKLSNTIGGVSPYGACQVVDDVLFMDQGTNLQLLSGIQEFGQVGLRNLSHIHTFGTYTRAALNLGRLDKVRAVFYPFKLEAHFACTQAGSSTNDARIVVDFNRPDLPRFRWSTRDSCESLWLRQDANHTPRLMAGDASGFVWKLDQSTFTKDGAGYRAEFQTPHLDFSWIDPTLATKNKLGQFLEIVAEPSGNWTLSADIIWDGNTIETVTFDLTGNGAVLGSFILDTDTLGQSSTICVRKRLVGSGRRLSIRFYNAGADQDFSIAHAYLSFAMGDERLKY